MCPKPHYTDPGLMAKRVQKDAVGTAGDLLRSIEKYALPEVYDPPTNNLYKAPVRQWSISIIEYCAEEVRRQGHDVTKVDGVERVGWMLEAWARMMVSNPRFIGYDTVTQLGELVERRKNRYGLRRCGVRVGTVVMLDWVLVPNLLSTLLQRQDSLSPFEFYREFIEIHPFEDGNGRVGKILLNWKNGTLDAPIFPPNDFWGTPIVNP